jgi:tetratricopeptide (TPR) repeat protein
MCPHVKLPWETRLGKVGEAEIQKRLSYFCAVTKITTDLGIDFYCELIEKDTPSLPFYVQTKGTEHFDNSWGHNIKKSTIQYWLQQSFPVFLVVYDENEGNCYYMSIEENRYSLSEKLYRSKANTIYFKLDRSHILDVGKNKNTEFIRKIKEDYYSIELFRGHPLLIGNGYVKKIPNPPRSEVELKRIKENVRVSSYSLIQHYANTNNLEDARVICEFLVEFDKWHFNHFLWLGQIYKKYGQNDLARKYFEEALRICELDKKWPRESMKQLIESIKAEIFSVS